MPLFLLTGNLSVHWLVTPSKKIWQDLYGYMGQLHTNFPSLSPFKFPDQTVSQAITNFVLLLYLLGSSGLESIVVYSQTLVVAGLYTKEFTWFFYCEDT